MLEKHWPDVPRWKEIRTLTWESFYERTGRRTVDVISGGFPCQPFSVAGKQRGKEDDRYLWPEMVRVIKELRPAWVVGENVAGIVRMALSDILSELEACGYRTRAFLIPACAVGARHRRYRVAIVGHAEHNGLSATTVCGSIGEAGAREQKGKDQTGEFEGAGESRDGRNVADTTGEQNRWIQQRRFQPDIGTSSQTMADTMRNSRKFSESPENKARLSKFADSGEDVQHADSPGRKEQHLAGEPDSEGFPGGRCDERDSHVSDTYNGSRDVRRNGEFSEVEETGRERCNFGNGEEEHEPGEWRSVEPGLGGVVDGISNWMDGDLDFILNHYWDTEPDIPRIAEGIPHRVDRLKALGNAVVPQQFYPIFKAIAEIERGNK